MRTSISRIGALLLVGSLVLVPRALWALGEQNGRITGVITAKGSGERLGGIDIKVTGPALIGGPRTLVSNDDGTYEVIELPPGSYLVEVGFPGTVQAKRRIEVRQGQTAPLNIAWSAQLEEVQTFNVVEERHRTNPDSTHVGSVLTKDQQAKVASPRSYQSLAQQVAGAVDINGGGNYQIKGGTFIQNHYLVDGLDITDPVTNTFSANINFDSLGSVQILTGGYEAQYNSLGGIINVVSTGGSDGFHVDSSFYVNNAKFSASNQYGPNLYDGVRDFGTFPVAPTQAYQANLNIGGPILKQKLWYNASFEYDYTERSIVIGPPLNVQHPSRRANIFLGRLKLSWAPTPKNLITLSASTDPASFDNVRQLNSRLGIAERHQNQGGVFAIAQWDYLRSKSFNSNVQLGFQFNHIDGGPQGYFGKIDNNNNGMFSATNNVYDYNRPRHVNNDDGTTWYNDNNLQLDQRYTVQFDPSVTFRGKWLGHHELKAGIQSRFEYHKIHREVPGGTFYSDAGGGVGENGLCGNNPANPGAGCFQRTDQGPADNHQWGIGIGAYIQDRWRATRRLTILPGVRIDWGLTRNTVNQTVANLVGAGPRLGGTFDITGDQKTIFSAFYGRSNDTLTLLPAANADVLALATVNQWNPATNKFEFLQTTGGANGYQIGKNLATPHSDEIVLGLRREVFRGTLASVTYTWKKIANMWDGTEINQIWNPSGTNVVKYANGQAQQITLYSTPNQNYRTYQGVDFEYEAQPTENFDFYAAYTLSWLYGPGQEEFGQISGDGRASQFYNPRQAQFYDGFLPEDVRHNVKVRASYTWHGLSAGLFANYQSGSPLRKVFFNVLDGAYTNARSPSGTEPSAPNSSKSIAEFRTADTLTVNLRAQFDFHALIRQHVSLIVDFFNLFNLAAATSLENRDVPTYGTIAARQAPFRFQLGLRYVY